MFLLILIIAIIYFVILALIILMFHNSKHIEIKIALIKGGAIGFFISLSFLIIASIIVEKNESYWWYGPPERMNWLVGITAFMALTGLIIGPVYGFKQARKRKNLIPH
ncbi:MAG TPA: hypothetical protein PK820_07920 [Candidatus Competibacteraceae bacterium]|nr:hypothetical protein [Candidatus Competibacteraceae bacterium]